MNNIPLKVLLTIVCAGFLAAITLLSPRWFNSVSAFGAAGVSTIDGEVDPGFLNGLSGANSMVEEIKIQPDGKIIIGGQFSTVNGVPQRGIARLNIDGSLDTSFHSEVIGSPVRVSEVEVQPDGKILVGGFFHSVNGLIRDNIARLNPDGTLDTGFLNAMSGPNGSVFAIAAEPDGKIVIGGQFTTVNGNSRNNFARLNADGTLDASFLNGLTGANEYVHAIAIQSEGKVLISGGFTTVNGIARNRIAKLNADGSLDTGFLNGGVGNSVDVFEVQPDGRIIIGGQFLSVGGVPRRGIARLNADGTLDTSFLNGLIGANEGITRAVARQPDGKILIGGHFQTVNNISHRFLARLNPDGTLDTDFLNGVSGLNGPAEAIAIQPDGKILIGGQFFTVNDVSRNKIARLINQASNQAPHSGFTISSGANGQLSAIEGQDLIINSRTGPVFVNFSGGRSSDSDGTIVSWNWTIDGVPASSSPSFTYGLNHATHTVSLKVTDNNGAISSASSSQIIVLSSLACSVTDIGPADSDTRLYADENDGNPLGGRTPLILIHGNHGNKLDNGADDVLTPNRKYFESLLNYFKDDSEFETRFKIFRFHYVSDRHYAFDIARSLKNDIDSQTCRDPNFDKQIIIVAHSMGGLVARSYMNEYTHEVGIYENRLGGARVNKLITLGTPHHGTPGANAMSRNEMSTLGWEPLLNVASYFYWDVRNTRLPTVDQLTATLPHDAPNRADLRWDNLIEMVNPENPDINEWLRRLNQRELFGNKIVAYFGYILPTDSDRLSLIARYNADGIPPLFNLILRDGLDAKRRDDEHKGLLIVSILLDYGMQRRFGYNDGLAPIESGRGREINISKRIACPGYDHADMRDGKNIACSNTNGLNLFQALEQELMNP